MRPDLGQQRWSDLSRFYHADGTPMALEDCPTEIALKQGRIVRGREAIIERPDGTRVPIIPFPTPLRDKAGAVVGVVNMTVDISERKKAELALAERNLQLSLAGRAGLVGSYAYDAGNELMQVSEGYAAIQGLPAGTTEIPRSRWQANVHPDDRARLVAIRSQAFRERRSEQRMEYRIVRGGDVRWIKSRSFISYNGHGRPQRVHWRQYRCHRAQACGRAATCVGRRARPSRQERSGDSQRRYRPYTGRRQLHGPFCGGARWSAQIDGVNARTVEPFPWRGSRWRS